MAFETLKLALQSPPVLAVFDPGLSTRVQCDASDFVVGGVLEQFSEHWHPVEFVSCKLNNAEVNYSATDREFLAIVHCLRKWRHFLMGRDFIVFSDHASLSHFQSMPHLNKRQIRWLEFLSEFLFKIVHKKGKDMVVPDALSRRPDQYLGNLVVTDTAVKTRLREAQSADQSDEFLEYVELAEKGERGFTL